MHDIPELNDSCNFQTGILSTHSLEDIRRCFTVRHFNKKNDERFTWNSCICSSQDINSSDYDCIHWLVILLILLCTKCSRKRRRIHDNFHINSTIMHENKDFRHQGNAFASCYSQKKCSWVHFHATTKRTFVHIWRMISRHTKKRFALDIQC